MELQASLDTLLPETKRIKYLEENAAVKSMKLSDSELKRISKLAPPGFKKGTRYSE